MEISRGFHRRHDVEADPSRVPPGQYVTSDFPVLSAGPTPHTPPSASGASRSGERSSSRSHGRGTSSQALASESVTPTSTASRSGRSSTRAGPAFRWTRCSPASRQAPVMSWRFSDGGYTTNLPLADVTGGKAWIALMLRRSSRSTPSTGGRHACSFPTCTSGRARSGCAGSSCSSMDEPGFWEGYGYHNYGDPWLEQRYAGD